MANLSLPWFLRRLNEINHVTMPCIEKVRSFALAKIVPFLLLL